MRVRGDVLDYKIAVVEGGHPNLVQSKREIAIIKNDQELLGNHESDTLILDPHRAPKEGFSPGSY